MGFKSLAARPYAFFIHKKLASDSKKAVDIQNKMLFSHLKKAGNTLFGKNHQFNRISSYEDYKESVPVRDYEELKTYFDQVAEGKKDVLWPGLPKYLAKTSGTTSGAKYIPITADSLPNHFGTARNAVFNFAYQSGNFKFMDGKMIFLSGSPELSETNGILTGRLSGISNHLIPNWLKRNQLPTYQTNTIEEWELKLDKIVEETLREDLRLISGIPPWVQMYFERLLTVTGAQTVVEVFPNFSIFVYGGVNYEPYRLSLEKLIGKSLDSVETYPASEGFIAFQDQPGETGLMLNVNSGIFFEFIPLREMGNDNPTRLKLDQVELDTDYALVLTSNAGLWAYDLGDTVRFLSLDPPRIQVSGRTKNYISAFGEHIIAKEVEESIQFASEKTGAKVVEFTVAPQVKPPEGGPPYHEWFIEFDEVPENLKEFSALLNRQMAEQNIYYKDLIDGKILKPLEVRKLKSHAFRNFMKSRGKLGGQNKVPRLSNDRKIADELEEYISS
nr:GH3 auxin-responsive promoter family protein [Saprospiraceae bacterium]